MQVATSPAATGTIPTLFCESFLGCLSPCPGGPSECTCLVLPPSHRPSPTKGGSASRFCPRTRFPRSVFRGCSYFVMFRVAVGTAVARCPPHRPVLARLVHTVPTLDVWRRSAHSCGFPHTVQLTCPAFPTRCSAQVWLVHVLLGQRPSLPSLRWRSPAWFGCFAGTIPFYDSPPPCMWDL